MSADARRSVRAEARGELVVFALLIVFALPGVLFWSCLLVEVPILSHAMRAPGSELAVNMAHVSAACGVGALVIPAHIGLKVLVALLCFSPHAAVLAFVAVVLAHRGGLF